ncbi:MULTISPECIES: PstS family phosphate ABC transporter substrate-binding protein [unclassified Flavobacterium]|jgi:phosphate transport system substrate-binding protein|uniref:PstS family phosphate ABC transporter substrate-binding protein n=1 Tax=unclassified Flavobacterium TaxID=196869 RepID=UPI000580B206|nr:MULTISPECIES: substrate-binding domain-containing protein [unclassified Flavobacterium]KIA98701.1 phosphate ABC transporter substrate-binding protein [Flavobacterium sp. KMS]KIC02542.1 phosphate ABC transporter substrate-binding protein [Flavobacterium sp. JRM]MEA9415596.1 substrate-binding domain-containing protein [Flavobacterium sp. PL02]
MLKNSKVLFLVLFGLLFITCNQKDKSKVDKESILKGSMDITVDETLVPIVEDQVLIFESTYDAKIAIKPKSEAELINDLLNQKATVAFTARDLTKEEREVFNKKKIAPRVTPVATDAIAFISNKDNNDTLIALKTVINLMQGKPEASIKGLVFDNPNSSTVRYLKTLAGTKDIPKEGVFSFKTNEEVIKFVSENKGMVGVVGVNWLSQPSPKMKDFVAKVNVLSVKGLTSDKFVAPTQNNIAEGTYPLARDLYIINCQGYSGLGIGFASFVGGDIGQRIVLKSGLLPIRVPGRKLNVRSEIINEKE